MVETSVNSGSPFSLRLNLSSRRLVLGSNAVGCLDPRQFFSYVGLRCAGSRSHSECGAFPSALFCFPLATLGPLFGAFPFSAWKCVGILWGCCCPSAQTAHLTIFSHCSASRSVEDTLGKLITFQLESKNRHLCPWTPQTYLQSLSSPDLCSQDAA